MDAGVPPATIVWKAISRSPACMPTGAAGCLGEPSPPDVDAPTTVTAMDPSKTYTLETVIGAEVTVRVSPGPMVLLVQVTEPRNVVLSPQKPIWVTVASLPGPSKVTAAVISTEPLEGEPYATSSRP